MPDRDETSPRPATIPDALLPEQTGVRASPLDPELQAVVALAERLGVPGIDVRVVPLDLTSLDLLPRELALRHDVVPLLQRDGLMFLAMGDPSNRKVIDELEFVTGHRITPFAADPDALRDLVARAYDARARGATELAPERLAIAAPPAHSTRPSSPSVPVLRGETLPPPVRRARAGTLLDPAPPPAGRPPPPPPEASSRPSSVPAPPPVPSPRSAPPPRLDTSRPVPPVTVRRSSPVQVALRRALVVDADVTARDALADALESMGFAVSEAGSSREALSTIDAQPPALVVVDPWLPDEPGFELLRKLRERPDLANVVFVVASEEYGTWRAARDLEATFGVRAVVPKPVSPAVLAVRISAALTPANAALDEVLPAAADDAMRRSTEAWQRGDIPEAVARLEEAVTAAPDSYRLRYHLGLTLGRQGEVFRAIREVEQSVALNDRFFPSLKNLAVLYERAGFRHKALEAWERAGLVAPDDTTRDQIRERVTALLS